MSARAGLASRMWGEDKRRGVALVVFCLTRAREADNLNFMSRLSFAAVSSRAVSARPTNKSCFDS
jgi:hypothetical protein